MGKGGTVKVPPFFTPKWVLSGIVVWCIFVQLHNNQQNHDQIKFFILSCTSKGHVYAPFFLTQV